MNKMVLTTGLLTLVSFTLSAEEKRPAGIPDDYKIVYQQDFAAADSLQDFQFTDAKAWRHGKTEAGRGYIGHFQKSDYKYKVRSPFNIGLISKLRLKDFVLDVEMQQTGREYGHRDLCLFYNFQDRSHFYYTHIAAQTDPHAHNIFIVNDKPRTSISKTTSKGHSWGSKEWHQVRLVREATSGKIEIYVNDMTKPIMTANDKTFDWGYVGFGSFDDTGRVSRVRVWAAESKPGEDGRKLFAD